MNRIHRIETLSWGLLLFLSTAFFLSACGGGGTPPTPAEDIEFHSNFPSDSIDQGWNIAAAFCKRDLQ